MTFRFDTGRTKSEPLSPSFEVAAKGVKHPKEQKED